jgi:hypothetical protein
MTELRCPDGHVTVSTDYCDVCGLPLAASSGGAAGPTQAMPTEQPDAAAANEKDCPNCHSVVPGADLFCEVCGYDFTTGQLPPAPNPLDLDGPTPAPPAPSPPSPAPGPPPVPSPSPPGPPPLPDPPDATGDVPPVGPVTWVAELWVDPDWYATQESDDPCPSVGMPSIIPLWDTSLLIGRVSVSRGIRPQLDCGADHGVSRRHAQLTTDGQRWWVEDLQSSNGTFLGVAGGPLPTDPVPAGQRTEFAPGDRVYVGAWTRIVVRKAT